MVKRNWLALSASFRFKLEYKEIPNVSDTLWLPNPSNPLELIPDTQPK